MQYIHHDTLDSTSAQAQRLLAEGRRGPLLITAAEQTAGRGRNGRSWCSPRGGVWLSILWPAPRPPAHYGPVPLLTGLAVLQALEQASDAATLELSIKWPNDVLLGGRKVAGILCQRDLHTATLIVGVGVNTNFDASLLPADLRVPAAVVQTDAAAFMTHFAQRFAAAMQELEQHGFTAAARQALRTRLAYRDQAIAWQTENATMQGIARDVDEQGRLLVEVLGIGGGTIAISSGEVQHVQAL